MLVVAMAIANLLICNYFILNLSLSSAVDASGSTFTKYPILVDLSDTTFIMK